MAHIREVGYRNMSCRGMWNDLARSLDHDADDAKMKTTAKRTKTYNSRCSLVVTDPTTNLPVSGLFTGERTGSEILHYLWSYVVVERRYSTYMSVLSWQSALGGLPLLRGEMDKRPMFSSTPKKIVCAGNRGLCGKCDAFNGHEALSPRALAKHSRGPIQSLLI